MDRLTNPTLNINTSPNIHLTFQVLNFLTSEYSVAFKISASEFKLLIILSSFIGKKGICPSMPLLAKRMRVSLRYVETLIANLKRKKLISWIEKDGHSNQYSFLFLSTTPDQIDGGSYPQPPIICDKDPRSIVTETPDQLIGRVYISNKDSNKSFYKAEQKKANEKKHDFAAMKNESASIKKNEAYKKLKPDENLIEKLNINFKKVPYD